MIDFSKVFFSIFWANRKLPLCWVRVSYSLPFIRNFSSIFHHIPNCEHSSFTLHHIPKLIRLATFFTLHSSPHTQAHSLGFTLHSSFFILHSSLFTLKKLPHTAFQANFQKFLGFYGKFHRELVKYFLPKTIHDE